MIKTERCACARFKRDLWRKPPAVVPTNLGGALPEPLHGITLPYPVELAERLIKMFSFVGDTVLDPFLGTGTTTVCCGKDGPQQPRV